MSRADPEEVGAGVRIPLTPEKSQIGFLSNTGPDPLKITKLPSEHSMLGHHPRAGFACGPMLACLQWYLDPPSPHQLKEYRVKVGLPLTKLSGSTHTYVAVLLYFFCFLSVLCVSAVFSFFSPIKFIGLVLFL